MDLSGGVIMSEGSDSQHWARIPNWVPAYAARYLVHTEKGVSIRELARRSNCHASTILRQIRRVEARRDDPLIDAALSNLSAQVSLPTARSSKKETSGMNAMTSNATKSNDILNEEARAVLTALCQPGAVLAVAPGVEKAAVMRQLGEGPPERLAVTDTWVAEAMALKDWIACHANGRVARYQITPEGRSAMQSMIVRGGEGATDHGICVDLDASVGSKEENPPKRVRFHSYEGPLVILARRRDKEGNPFLSRDLVKAGERLREDFELAHLEPGLTQDWLQFLTPATKRGVGDNSRGMPAAARERVQKAMEVLGEGLSDVALSCCCHMEGMEATEKRLGWPARSGKIVLRIALTRLAQHYRTSESDMGDLIY